jgi:hypothetical protein
MQRAELAVTMRWMVADPLARVDGDWFCPSVAGLGRSVVWTTAVPREVTSIE